MTYRVLRPVYTPYYEAFTVSWREIGFADSMAEAKRIFGGSPVLELIR